MDDHFDNSVGAQDTSYFVSVFVDKVYYCDSFVINVEKSHESLNRDSVIVNQVNSGTLALLIIFRFVSLRTVGYMTGIFLLQFSD